MHGMQTARFGYFEFTAILMIRATVLLVLLAASASAEAGVYKCKGPTGAIVYSQFRCAQAPAPETPAAVPTPAQNPQASAKTGGECPARTREINDRFSDEAAAATRDIRRLREHMAATNGYSADTADKGLRAELDAAEDRLDEAGRRQRQGLVDLRKDCGEAHASAENTAK